MVSYDRGDPRIITALGRHRINVCRGGRTGDTTGALTGIFSTTTLKRPYRYAVCISAEQALRNGRISRHYECTPVDLLLSSLSGLEAVTRRPSGAGAPEPSGGQSSGRS